MAHIDHLSQRNRHFATTNAHEGTSISATHQVCLITGGRPCGDAGMGTTLRPPARECP
ncbi:MAG: hypothetical protein ACLP5E_10530 [Streptosporangiaceae bacterium]